MIENPFSLKNKTILVTGASSGIGRSCSILLSELGAQLIICGRNQERLVETLNLLNNKEVHSIYIGDLTNETEIETLVEKVDVLNGIVLAAGITKTLPFKFLNERELSNIMNTNFQAPVILCQKLAKKKKIKNNSSIVFISSIAGNVIGNKGNGAYAASKAALNGICKVMAIELASQKIRTNCVSPGMVKTPMTANGFSSVSKEQLELNEKLYPLGYGEPEDVACSVAFLLTDASKWITGTSLVIDGGFSTQ